MTIPFYPELKRLTGRHLAALHLQQTEFFFSLQPDGFYKFLTPCSHRDCRPGDSWTEELECSKKELYGSYVVLRTIRYNSKPEADAAAEAGQLFGEDGQAWYCTWYDRISGKVEHRRNHAVVEAALLEAGYPPAVERASAKREYAPSNQKEHGQKPSDKRELGNPDQVTKGNLTKLQNGTCPSDKRELVYKEQKDSLSERPFKEEDLSTHAHELELQCDGIPEGHARAITQIMTLSADGGLPIDQLTAERLILRHGIERIQQELAWMPLRKARNEAATFQAALKSPPQEPRSVAQTRASPGMSRRQRERLALIEDLAQTTKENNPNGYPRMHSEMPAHPEISDRY